MPEQAETHSRAGSPRFTLDGSRELELHVASICSRVLEELLPIIGARSLDALVLGGGYGRGQGGVLRTPEGDRPYNDLEFYVFVRGNRLWQERRCRLGLARCTNRLAPAAGIHLELKLDSMKRFRLNPVTMFSYDLVSRHRILYGRADLFTGCEHHLRAEQIPLAEATRLLFNRCSGLLLSKESLQQDSLTAQPADFVGRNLAKAQLGLGDAVLTAFGQYHWDCLKRHARVEQLRPDGSMPWLRTIQTLHGKGVEFKLRPQHISKAITQFRAEHAQLAGLALQVWLWLETRRLNCNFATAADYAFHRGRKWPGTAAWKNLLLNVRTFGLKSVFDSYAPRYPRERLFNALSLLLWSEQSNNGKETELLRKQLRAEAHDWWGLVNAYKQLWPPYG